MAQLQEVFARMQANKSEQKEIKAAYKDALNNNQQYQEMVEELKLLKDKKKSFELATQAEFGKDFDRLDQLKDDLQSDQQLLSDLAINHVMDGELVEVTDEKENIYEPVFSVRFKKVG